MGCVGMNKIIGITGMMATGKTTIAKELIKRNPDFIYIDVDEFRRNKLKDKYYQQEVKEKIKEIPKTLEVTTTILNSYIYKNEDYMKAYKEILYHHLFQYMETFHNKTILLDWALILNDHLENKCDKIIYVKTSLETRQKRMKHSDLSREELTKRWKLQEIKDIRQSNKLLIVENEKTLPVDEINSFIHQMECKFTLPEHGGKAIWEITHQCNYQCSYCIFSCNGKKIPHELTTKECFKVIDQLVENDFKYLKITGGEPFIRKDIIEILQYASTRLRTDISTNASLITKSTVEKLNEIPLKMIHVSLDGTKREHESVRGKNTYQRTMRGLRALKESKNKVRIGTVIHANNENKLEKFIESCNEVVPNEIIFSIMEPMDHQDKNLIKKKSLDTLAKELDLLKQKYQSKLVINYNFKKQPTYVKKCPAGDKFLYINNLGQISPCPWIYEKNKNIVTTNSLKDYTLEELLHEKTIVSFIKGKKEGTCYGKI